MIQTSTLFLLHYKYISQTGLLIHLFLFSKDFLKGKVQQRKMLRLTNVILMVCLFAVTVFGTTVPIQSTTVPTVMITNATTQLPVNSSLTTTSIHLSTVALKGVVAQHDHKTEHNQINANFACGTTFNFLTIMIAMMIQCLF